MGWEHLLADAKREPQKHCQNTLESMEPSSFKVNVDPSKKNLVTVMADP